MRVRTTQWAALAVAILLSMSTLVVAQATQQRQNERSRDTAQRRQTKTRQSAETARADMPGTPVRVSEVLGLNVQNAAGEDIGEINDIVLDPKSGRVRYAALSFGGLLGLGDKLFAIPWDAFDCRYDASEEEHVVILRVTEKGA